MRYYASARYQMALPRGVKGVDGAIIAPSGIAMQTLVHRGFRKYPHMGNRLLDPQLYLADLNPTTSQKACTKLFTYGWFRSRGDRPEFRSREHTRQEWLHNLEARITRIWERGVPSNESEVAEFVGRCVAFQTSIKCAGIILPSPMAVDPGTDYSVQSAWLDIGLDEAAQKAPGTPRFASVIVSDGTLRSMDPWANPLLDLIIDQVSARMPEGAYVVIEQSNEAGYYCTHPNTVGAMLRIVHGLAAGGLREVVVGFAGMAGLLALAAGATGWCTGWYRGERRLKLTDLEEEVGRSVPTYYSHSLASEIHCEEDLDAICRLGLLRELGDRTEASNGLLLALADGHHVRDVPAWRHQMSNVSASRAHLASVAVRETRRLSRMTPRDRVAHVQRWLGRAEELASRLASARTWNQKTALTHQAGWLQAFEAFVRNSGSA